MSETQLRRHLEQLRAELEATDSVDPDARALLEDLVRDLQELIERSEEAEVGSGDSLVDRLSEAARRFEESHPALSATVGRIADTLSNLGI